MFKNFKLTEFLTELAFGQQSVKQCGCKNEGSHGMESFYKNFLFLETKNYSKPGLKEQSKTSHFSFYEDLSPQNRTQTQIIYLKRKPQVVKFIQFGDKFYDHVAIKFQISNKQKQTLKKNLDCQFLMKQKQQSKWQNTSISQKQKNQFFQTLFDYYFEDASSFCSSLCYVYLVFQKWNEGILQKLDQVLTRNQNRINQLHAHDDKNLRMRSTHASTRQTKHTPIKKMQSAYSSMCNDKSQNGYPIKNTPQFKRITERKSVNPMGGYNVRSQIAKELLKLVKNIIFGLYEEYDMTILRTDLRVCNFLYSSDYKLSNSLIPPQTLLFILSSQLSNNNNNNNNNNAADNDNSQQLTHDSHIKAVNQAQQSLLNISYASPEELSQIIKHGGQSSDGRCKDLQLSSLLFKLGMGVLELWGFCQWRLKRNEQNGYKTNRQWIGIRDKLYVLDQSLLNQFNNRSQSKNKQNNRVKIDWLGISNLLKEIQRSLNVNDLISALFVKVLKSLLSRSAVQRSKAKSLLKDEGLENILKPPLNFVQQQHTNKKYLSQNLSTSQYKFPLQAQPPHTSFQNVTISTARNHIPIPIQRNSSNVNLTMNLPVTCPKQMIKDFYQKLPISISNSNLQISQNFNKKTQALNFISASYQYTSNPSTKSYISLENVLNNPSKTFKTSNSNNFNSITPITSYKVQKPLLQSSSLMSFKTPQFKQNKIHSEYFRVNSVSQDEEGKQLYSWNQQKKAQAQVRREEGQESKDNITDPQTEKGNSQQSWSWMPDLQQESPIKKKPSSLLNQPSESSELPSHLPQSSTYDSILNIESVIKVNKYDSIIETNSTTLQKDSEQPIRNGHQNPSILEAIQQSDNPNHSDQLQKALNKIRMDKARVFQSVEYIDPSFQQPNPQQHGDPQSEYVTENYIGGGCYEGNMKNKKRNGYGKLFYQDGSWYEGEWLDDQMNGYGKLYYDHGMLAYEGNWVGDMFHGEGKVYNDKPARLDVEFDYTDFDNLDEHWTHYEGELQHDLKHGHGIIMLENGQYFQGEFHAGMINGQGKFVNLEGENIHGVWINNVLTQLIEVLEI